MTDAVSEAARNSDRRVGRVRTEVRHALEIVALCAFVFAKPVLDVFGRSPETFIQHGASRPDIIGFARVDAAAREVIAQAGYGEHFVHRTGHGIGVEAHEERYLVRGNTALLDAGNVFSVEPGIYLEGRFGLRLEDIVVATDAGPQRLNRAPRDLAVVT